MLRRASKMKINKEEDITNRKTRLKKIPPIFVLEQKGGKTKNESGNTRRGIIVWPAIKEEDKHSQERIRDEPPEMTKRKDLCIRR